MANTVSTAELTAAVATLRTAVDGAIALINVIPARIQAAVTAALQADEVADQGSIDVANAAIAAEVIKITKEKEDLAAALLAGTPPDIN